MFVIYVAPFFNEGTIRFLEALVRLEGVRLGVISQEPQEVLDPKLWRRFAGHWRVEDSLKTKQLVWAARELSMRHGPIHRLLAANEQVQVPLAELRQIMGVEGMDPEVARNFRDKARMKEVFRSAGIPCAHHCAAHNEQEAWDFLERCGYPVCVKPIDGAATQSTYRVEDAKSMKEVLRASGPSMWRPLQIEEFVTGVEHSFETVSIHGEPIWHPSLTRYVPTPLDAMENPWIQYQVIYPREIDGPEFDDIRVVGRKVLKALGMGTGLSHMEWFRRADGTIAVGEIAARPPGVQIVPLINRVHDMDMYRGWAELMCFDRFDPPQERKYAAGCAFLRGLGAGRVAAVHGLSDVLSDLQELVTDVKFPTLGQPKAISYEGEGYVIVRHPETRIVVAALDEIVGRVRVELMD